MDVRDIQIYGNYFFSNLKLFLGTKQHLNKLLVIFLTFWWNATKRRIARNRKKVTFFHFFLLFLGFSVITSRVHFTNSCLKLWIIYLNIVFEVKSHLILKNILLYSLKCLKMSFHITFFWKAKYFAFQKFDFAFQIFTSPFKIFKISKWSKIMFYKFKTLYDR